MKPSECDAWLSRYSLGSASRNLRIACVKELFVLAVRDRIISASPAAHLHSVKREKPIRLTPTFKQFKAIIADVRAQPFSADAQDSADFLEFLGLAGLGQAEAGSLTPADVDFEAQRIITFRHKTTTGFAVPLYPQVRPLLERLCEFTRGGQVRANANRDISEQKQDLRTISARIACGAAKRIEDELAAGTIKGTQLVPVYGVATDKVVALSESAPSIQININTQPADIYSELRAIQAEIIAALSQHSRAYARPSENGLFSSFNPNALVKRLAPQRLARIRFTSVVIPTPGNNRSQVMRVGRLRTVVRADVLQRGHGNP